MRIKLCMRHQPRSSCKTTNVKREERKKQRGMDEGKDGERDTRWGTVWQIDQTRIRIRITIARPDLGSLRSNQLGYEVLSPNSLYGVVYRLSWFWIGGIMWDWMGVQLYVSTSEVAESPHAM